MKTRTWIAILVYPMVNAVLFGIGIVAVLSIPALAESEVSLIPAVVVASFVLALPIAWFLAPRLRLRFWRDREQQIGPGFRQDIGRERRDDT